MANLSGTVKKVWVFSVAAALIAGSGVTMNFILGSKTFAENSDRVIQQQAGGKRTVRNGAGTSGGQSGVHGHRPVQELYRG
ncbi:hypothetical protein LJK88_08610 [Paenibacillus sp. P26]|nr:hypothetical protein LJK88_08610 [Paenibacillus sp. P26]